jgi:ADP-ribosylation factor-like protein 2
VSRDTALTSTDSELTDILESGLDNAGKTTIVKKIMGEDVNSVSPTLGFIIKTIEYEG